MSLPPLILASSSPRRAELLRALGVEFQVLVGNIEEVAPEHLTPHEIAQINAYRKARVVAKRSPDALVLGADTIVCLGGRVFGKPTDRADASRMWTTLRPLLTIRLTCWILTRPKSSSPRPSFTWR